MNIQDLHTAPKEVSANALFKGETGIATAIRLKARGILKEHITKTPAMLICINGSVRYQSENGEDISLRSGDYTPIPPMVKHWLEAEDESHLILLK